MSFPLSPAFAKAGPDHRMKAYVIENANVENARDATSGAPSPWKVFEMTAIEAPATSKRDHRSEWVRLDAILLESSGNWVDVTEMPF